MCIIVKYSSHLKQLLLRYIITKYRSYTTSLCFFIQVTYNPFILTYFKLLFAEKTQSLTQLRRNCNLYFVA